MEPWRGAGVTFTANSRAGENHAAHYSNSTICRKNGRDRPRHCYLSDRHIRSDGYAIKTRSSLKIAASIHLARAASVAASFIGGHSPPCSWRYWPVLAPRGLVCRSGFVCLESQSVAGTICSIEGFIGRQGGLRHHRSHSPNFGLGDHPLHLRRPDRSGFGGDPYFRPSVLILAAVRLPAHRRPAGADR